MKVARMRHWVGIGLNLVMTMEILQEEQVKGVNNIIVYYRNEYIPSSANMSNKIRDTLLPQLNATTRGSVCTADLTNLNFIAANSFDLVFTGKTLLILEHLNKVRCAIASILCSQLKSYKMSIVSSTILGYVSILLDPLDLKQSLTDNFDAYEQVCQGDSWKDKMLAEVAQQRQNNWFGTWVGKMVCVAKPGAPVIVEQVSHPLFCCKAFFDWGGVNQDFGLVMQSTSMAGIMISFLY